jgi:hypothetical protein
MKIKPALIWLGGVAAMWSNLFAQEIPHSAPERIGGSRYFIGKENELLIPVNVLGYVNKPGQYMVPNGTDLISLVSYAGGFHVDANMAGVRVVRGQVPEGGKPEILQVNVKEYFHTGNREKIPSLNPDDTVIVNGSSHVMFRTVFDFIARVSVLAQIYFYIKVATQY